MFVKTIAQLFSSLSDVVKRNRRDNDRLCLHNAKTVHMGKVFFVWHRKFTTKSLMIIEHFNTKQFKCTL